MRAFKQLLPLLLATVAMLIFFRIQVPGFLDSGNLLSLIDQISVNAILAFGMTLTILIGGIDLSVGALLALVGTTVVYFLRLSPGDAGAVWNLFIAVFVAMGVAVAFGAFNGICAATTRMPPFIITLGTMLVARGTPSLLQADPEMGEDPSAVRVASPRALGDAGSCS